MKHISGYSAKILGVVLALTVLAMPILLTPSTTSAQCYAYYEVPVSPNPNCLTQTIYPPDYFCFKICDGGFFDERDAACDDQCGTSAVQVTNAACINGGTDCECEVECL